MKSILKIIIINNNDNNSEQAKPTQTQAQK